MSFVSYVLNADIGRYADGLLSHTPEQTGINQETGRPLQVSQLFEDAKCQDGAVYVTDTKQWARTRHVLFLATRLIHSVMRYLGQD